MTIYGFKAGQSQQANDQYLELEKRFSERTDKNVVLVSVDAMKKLRKAYPNYFADTNSFRNYCGALPNRITGG